MDENLSPRIADAFRILGKSVLHVVKVPGLGRGATDEIVLPFVGERGYRLVSLDTGQPRTPQLKALIMSCHVGAYYVRSRRKDRQEFWEIVEILVRHWREIERDAATSKPPYVRTVRWRGGVHVER